MDHSRYSAFSRQSSYVDLQSVKSTIVKQFTFSDHSLAIQVRERMINLLAQFDANKDLTFDQQEIANALVTLLMQSKSEIKYVLKNVFRYDVNNDGEVTYQQLTNFCVQQHFGEIAIQRLHRDQLYSRGNDRIMNLQQFMKTIKYCLSFIQIIPKDQFLKTLFKEIDLKNQQWIKYSTYFNFLKEYFGSKSYASNVVKIDDQGVIQFRFSDSSQIYNPHFKLLDSQPQPKRNTLNLQESTKNLVRSSKLNTDIYDRLRNYQIKLQNSVTNHSQQIAKSQRCKHHLAYSLNVNQKSPFSQQNFQNQNNQKNVLYKSIFRQGAFSKQLFLQRIQQILKNEDSILRQVENKIASLIYTQLKVNIMKYDNQHNLYLSKKKIQEIMTKQFKITYNQIQCFISQVLKGQQKVSYQNFMQEVMLYYFCQVILNRNPTLKIIKIRQFCQLFDTNLSFLKVKPNKNLIQTLFRKNDYNNDGQMNLKDYINMMVNLFRVYYFRKYRTMADII